MTNKERQLIKAWNIKQGEIKDNAETKYQSLRKKYKELIGHISCSYHGLMFQIATCDKVSESDKLNDLATLCNDLIAYGRYEALMDYIFTVH